RSASTSRTEREEIRSMNKRMTIVAALSAVTVALACNDKKFLTEQPFDFIGPTNFYHNSGDALAAINGVYADFINSTGDDYYGRNFVVLAEHTTEMWMARCRRRTNVANLRSTRFRCRTPM